MLLVVLIFLLFLVGSWFWVTQPLFSSTTPTSVSGVDFSDQLNYWHAGYNAVMITDTAFYRNRNYHTAQDTEEKLDYKRMAMVVEGVYAVVADLAKQ